MRQKHNMAEKSWQPAWSPLRKKKLNTKQGGLYVFVYRREFLKTRPTGSYMSLHLSAGWHSLHLSAGWNSLHLSALWHSMHLSAGWQFAPICWMTQFAPICWMTQFAPICCMTQYAPICWMTQFAPICWMTQFAPIYWMTQFLIHEFLSTIFTARVNTNLNFVRIILRVCINVTPNRSHVVWYVSEKENLCDVINRICSNFRNGWAL